jgi:hypothetical protein
MPAIAGHGADALREDAEHEHREQARGREPERERDDLADEARRIDAEQPRDDDREPDHRAADSSRCLVGLRIDHAVVESCATLEEITSSSPLAVDSAAASPPAAISAMIHDASSRHLRRREHDDVLVRARTAPRAQHRRGRPRRARRRCRATAGAALDVPSSRGGQPPLRKISLSSPAE